MSYNAIRENKILAKITGFTVLWMFSFTHLIQMKFPTFANWTSPFPLKGLFIQILIEHSVKNSGDPDQMLRPEANFAQAFIVLQKLHFKLLSEVNI